ncbi:radical SAM protein (plasmid) [Clostridium estertheticum]|uniref:SPL family radical SAM protein n=1 Tax=Clostridium estertheticum TaxID=238834 RepID=UPI001C7CC6B1|nr:radical SAM protein [Clostridium estertheticum]MBX4262200.1 radical SAM protein [Clostridium estertheticum]WLC73161.1 radical SAM protein [Clostridium estertheticum]
MHYQEYKSILSPKNGMNIYRGCSHGCIYCDSRSSCYNMKHDFCDIEIKRNAPQMLEETLKRKRKKCMVATGAMSDPYIHVEEELLYTRKCLEIIDKYGFGLSILTKSNRILRDLDLLKSINKKSKCVVQMTLTTSDENLCSTIEPNVSTTKERFETLKIMSENGIPTVVWLSPFLPFINDSEENFQRLLDYCIEAKVYGIMCFGIGLTLREGNREYFYEKLDECFPYMKQKYIKTFGNSYECHSDNHSKLMKILYYECKKHSILVGVDNVFSYLNSYEDKNSNDQISLF